MRTEKSSIDSIVGLNLDDLEVQVNNVWKMVWEQVLLLAFYSRRQYFGKGDGADAINFRQRMKLISLMDELINKKTLCDLEDIYQTVIDKIESNGGSNKVLEVLFDDKDDQKIIYAQQSKTKKEIIRDEIEKNGIAFSSTTKEMQYSYYAMYKSLKDLVGLLQRASSYDNLDVKQDFYNFIRHLIEKDMSQWSFEPPEQLLANKSNQELTDEQYIRQHLDILKKIVNTEDRRKEIISNFYEELIIGRKDDSSGEMILGIGMWAKNVFNFTALNTNKENKSTSEFYAINEDTADITVTLNKAQLKDIMHLGLLEPLFDEIALKSELLISKEKNEYIKDIFKHDASSALEAISEWYTQNNVGLFVRSNQIPRLIAHLLSFDIENHRGIYDTHIGGINLYDRALNGFTNPKKASEKNLQVFLVMKYCLYQGQNLGFLYTNLLRRVNVNKDLNTAEQSIKVIQDLNNIPLELDTRRNALFEEWGNLEAHQDDVDSETSLDEKLYNRMMNRFKRTPKYTDSKGSSVDYFSDKLLEQIVTRQKHQTRDKTVTYPFSSNFPLPLWVKI